MASPPSPAMEFLGRVAFEIHQMKPLLPTYIHLLASAIFPIYTAAHASLARPSSAAPAKKLKTTDDDESQDEETSPTIESLTPSDAILFPVLAGTTLVSLYFILKWLQDPALLNYYLGLYFAIVGLFFAIKFVKDGLSIVRSFVLPNQYSYRGRLWKLESGKRRFVTTNESLDVTPRTSPLPGRFSIVFQSRNATIWSLREFVYTKLQLKFGIWKLINVVTPIDTLDVTALVIATPLVYYHTFIGKPWFLTNLLGFSFCYGSLQITTPGTSSTGTLLLCALFFYDIYFVFFTPMMVTVATKLDVPIKLLFPRPDGCIKPVGVAEGSEAMQEYIRCVAKKRTMAMLGLGDIVIPGMMLAFALRFDLYLYYRKLAVTTRDTSKDDKDIPNKVTYSPATGSWGERFWTTTKLHTPNIKAKQFPKVYFTASTVGYILGMVATVLVMQVSQHAQPALLYLVPGVLSALWGVALVRGDFKALWNYSEVPEDEKKKDEEDQNGKMEDKKAIEDNKTGDRRVENGAAEPGVSNTGEGDESNAKLDSNTTTEPDARNNQNTPKVAQKEKSNDKSDETHLVYFSLTIAKSIKPTADQEPEKQRLAIDSTVSHSPSGKLTANVDSSSSEEWSSENANEADESSDSNTKHDTGYKRQSVTLKPTPGKSSVSLPTATGTKDGEPDLKRRRKA